MATSPSYSVQFSPSIVGGADASEAAKVIPGPSERRWCGVLKSEARGNAFDEVHCDLAGDQGAALGDFARHTATKLLPYSHYMLALWLFENEAKLDRGGIEWDFLTEGIHTPRQGGDIQSAGENSL
jgi:hypothetical protein